MIKTFNNKFFLNEIIKRKLTNMNQKMMMAGGPVLFGVLVAATQYLGWNESLQYLWALAAIVWGLMAFYPRK